MKCPECAFENLQYAEWCEKCGYNFLKRRLEPSLLDLTLEKRGHRGDFFSFRKLISPSLIKGSYVIGAIVITVIGVLGISAGLTGATHEYGDPVNLIWGGLTVLVVGHLLWRMFCEMMILLFSIHELLVSLDDKAQYLTESLRRSR